MDAPGSPFYDSNRVLRSDLMVRHVHVAEVFDFLEWDVLELWRADDSDFDPVFE